METDLHLINQFHRGVANNQRNLDDDLPKVIELEVQRLTKKYGKDVFGSDDLQKVLSIGRCKALELLNDQSFPTLDGLNKVSVLGFVIWTVKKYYCQL